MSTMGIVFFIIPFLLFALWLKLEINASEKEEKEDEEKRKELAKKKLEELEEAKKKAEKEGLVHFKSISEFTCFDQTATVNEQALYYMNDLDFNSFDTSSVSSRTSLLVFVINITGERGIKLYSKMFSFYSEELTLTNIDGYYFYDQKELDSIRSNIMKLEGDAIEQVKDKLNGLTSEERTK